jgi:hypothetical protein
MLNSEDDVYQASEGNLPARYVGVDKASEGRLVQIRVQR